MTEPPRASGPRGLVVAVLGGLTGGGIALLGATRPWARTQVVAEGAPRVAVQVLGTDAAPTVGAAALVVVTASLALLPTSGLLRRVVAALLVLAALGVLVGTLTAAPSVSDALGRALLATASTQGSDVAALAAAAERTLWRWLSLAGGLLSLSVGVWAVLRGHRWTVMGRRYEAPAVTTGTTPARAGGTTEDVDLWRALDDGRDPTL